MDHFVVHIEAMVDDHIEDHFEEDINHSEEIVEEEKWQIIEENFQRKEMIILNHLKN